MCLATHIGLNERVAIKKIPLTNKNGKDMYDDAQTEFNVINKLTHNHPNIVKFYELIITKDQENKDLGYYLVYELGSGGSLADHLKLKGKFEESEARDLIL